MMSSPTLDAGADAGAGVDAIVNARRRTVRRAHGRFPRLPPGPGGVLRPGAPGVLLALLLASVALVAPRPAQAQGVEEGIRELGVDNARLYLRPVTTGLGAGMNSAWFESAGPLEFPHVNLSVRAMGTIVPDESDSFQPVLPASVTVDELGGQTFQDPYGTGDGLVTPTASGQGPGISVEPRGAFRDSLVANGLDPSAFALAFPQGFDIPAVPLAVLQGSLGLAAGTEVTLRLVPSLEFDQDIGSLQSFGFGVKHNVSQWLAGGFPLDLAVAGGIQSFDAGDYLSADSRYAALVASKDLAALTLFASGVVEESDVDVSYTLENSQLPGSGTAISFSDEGENSSRLTAGFNFDLLFLQAGASYTYSSYDVATAHLGLSF